MEYELIFGANFIISSKMRYINCGDACQIRLTNLLLAIRLKAASMVKW
ncbi:MAG: hypothetical protein KTV77_02460 [Wolbachia endosymbiont of Fragariocoptes setiger]|nr:hypothetical protein [Wolbachia endosymbiont of Fragariocoptes setiger]